MDQIQVPRGSIWAAEAFAQLLDKSGWLIDCVNRALSKIVTDSPIRPDDCKTPEELRQFAYSIRNRQPSLAADLLAAADRADNERDK